MKGTLLPGLTKASKFNEEKKPLKKKVITNKKFSPYQDDLEVANHEGDHKNSSSSYDMH